MRGAREITCRELVELVTDYLEGVLPADRRARFEEHLATCEWCVTHLDQMRQTRRALGALAEDTISIEARNALLRAFREHTA